MNIVINQSQSADLATNTLKEIVQFSTARGSPVFASFSGATKAFDRVLLFNRLLDTGWPPFNIIIIWYGILSDFGQNGSMMFPTSNATTPLQVPF